MTTTIDHTGGTFDRFGRYRPAATTPQQSARRFAALRAVAGVDPCEYGSCTERARERFGVLTLCRPHAVEAAATAYAMEIGGSL